MNKLKLKRKREFKMKKVLTIVLCVIMSVSIIGCSSKKNNPPKEQLNDVESNAGNSEKSNSIIYFGKVKSIVGNEIELELAENQDNSNEEGGNSKVESTDELGPGASREDAASDVGASGGSEGDGSDGDGLSLEVDDSNKLELKYTGESEKLIIPTGAKILDIRSGDEAKLTSIKAGTVIRVYATGSKEVPQVDAIDIVE